MPTSYRVLGQVNPAAWTAITLYTVPAGTSAVVSTLNICNQAAATATFRVAVRPAGATLAAAHYLAYDASLVPNDAVALTLGMSLAATDVVTVLASTTTVSFVLFGAEIT